MKFAASPDRSLHVCCRIWTSPLTLGGSSDLSAVSAQSLAFPRLLTIHHRRFLATVAESPFQRHVIFTDGTALAAVSYGPRHSEDLDLFSVHPLDAGLLLPWQRRLTRSGFRLERQILGARHRHLVTPPRARTPVRVDFVEFPFESIEPCRPVPAIGLRVDPP